MYNNVLFKSFLLLILISSCITRRASITTIDNTEYKIIYVSNISFFENIIIDTIHKSKNRIALFYNQNNNLEFLELNVKGLKTQRFYFFVKEGGNILVANSLGPRYINVDTLFFLKDRCYHKIVNYTVNLQGQTANWAGMTSFNVYAYTANELRLSVNRLYINDSLAAKERIYDFVKKHEGTDNLTPYQIIETNIDKNISKLSFFRKYFGGP
jgi:hypothetical protein